MAFFSKKKKNNPSDPTPERKNTVALKCPDCGFEQPESRMAVSTYCRGCGNHYKISGGKPVPNKTATGNPFASLKNSGQTPRLRPRGGTPETGSEDTSSPADTAAAGRKPGAAPAPPPSGRPASKPPAAGFFKKAAANAGLGHGKEKNREVSCFECGKVHQAPAVASSTLCPACGAYIALKDYEILSNWNRRIQTRGNVVIHKKATVTGITIHCHHLTSHGNFTGGVDCSGDFTIRSHGKIMGRVRCKRLIIEKRAKVEFANTVHCQDAIIDGCVTGHFECSGKLLLKKKATLAGDIKVATMAVEEGARHTGRMSIGQ